MRCPDRGPGRRPRTARAVRRRRPLAAAPGGPGGVRPRPRDHRVAAAGRPRRPGGRGAVLLAARAVVRGGGHRGVVPARPGPRRPGRRSSAGGTRTDTSPLHRRIREYLVPRLHAARSRSHPRLAGPDVPAPQQPGVRALPQLGDREQRLRGPSRSGRRPAVLRRRRRSRAPSRSPSSHWLDRQPGACASTAAPVGGTGRVLERIRLPAPEPGDLEADPLVARIGST